MTPVLGWLAQAAAVSAVLACVAWIASRRLGARPAVCHALWLLVVLRLLVPPGLVGSWALPLAAAESPAVETVVTPVRPASIDAASPAARVAPIRPSAVPSTRPAPAAIPWSTVLACAWLAGALATILVFARGVFSAARSLRRGRVADRRVRRIVHRVALRMRVAAPRVVAVDRACAPFVWALGRPRLVVPTALADALDAGALEAVIVHELAHLKRRDHWVGRALLVAAILHWWNPVFWWARRRIHETAEQSCDAWVVEMLPGARHRYANTLIEVSRIVTTGTPAMAIGMGSVTYHELKRRLQMILDTTPRRGVPTVGAIAIALLGLVASPDVTLAQSADEGPRAGSAPAPVPERVVEVVTVDDEPVSVSRAGGRRDGLTIRFSNGRWVVQARGSTYTLNPDGTMTSRSGARAKNVAPRPTGSRTVGRGVGGRRAPAPFGRGPAAGGRADVAGPRAARAAAGTGSRDPVAGPFGSVTEEVIIEEEIVDLPAPSPRKPGLRQARRRIAELEREIARLEKMIAELSRDTPPAPRR